MVTLRVLRQLIMTASIAALVAACAAQPVPGPAAPATPSSAAHTGHPPATLAPTPSPTGPPEPRTAKALLKIATVFNNEYDNGDYGPVYDRWDARSQAIISRADYIQRHVDCPSATHVQAVTESARRGPHGAWLVDYEISGDQLTDYWFYVHGRWVFDLVLSNPGAVKLYRLSPHQYAVAQGCTH